MFCRIRCCHYHADCVKRGYERSEIDLSLNGGSCLTNLITWLSFSKLKLLLLQRHGFLQVLWCPCLHMNKTNIPILVRQGKAQILPCSCVILDLSGLAFPSLALHPQYPFRLLHSLHALHHSPEDQYPPSMPHGVPPGPKVSPMTPASHHSPLKESSRHSTLSYRIAQNDEFQIGHGVSLPHIPGEKTKRIEFLLYSPHLAKKKKTFILRTQTVQGQMILPQTRK